MMINPGGRPLVDLADLTGSFMVMGRDASLEAMPANLGAYALTMEGPGGSPMRSGCSGGGGGCGGGGTNNCSCCFADTPEED